MISFTKLRAGHILGIVDSYGAVHSKFTETIECHGSFWPTNTHCKWRWSFNKGIWWTVMESRPKNEEFDSIRAHLEKKYRIKFWDNGYHDMDFFLDKLNEERRREKTPQKLKLSKK